jgi:arabinofuranosyltransferase
MPSLRSPNPPLVLPKILIAAPLLIYALTLARTAWLSDDAYITFRAVDQLLAGHGPVWNVGERVQVYSHPLWYLVVTMLRAAVGEFFDAVLAFSCALSLLALSMAVLRGSAPWLRAAFLVILCCFSRAFVDYSTSGLENPLSHVLAALFFFALAPRRAGVRCSYAGLCFLAGLAALNRLDTMLIYLPALIAEAYFRWRPSAGVPRTPAMRLAGAALLGFFPLFLWLCFSLIYYGVPFPNTAYAKLSTGIPRLDLLGQGFHYFLHSLRHDPITLSLVGLAAVAAFLERDIRARAFAAGMLLYLIYVLRIGGDFMAGRFFSLPFFCAILLLADLELRRISRPVRWVAAAAVILIAGVWSVQSRTPLPLWSPANYPASEIRGVAYDWRGIADERAAYYRWTGWMRDAEGGRSPETHLWARMGTFFRKDAPPVVVLSGIGLAGWQMGAVGYVVDLNGLSDPLLARLPAMINPPWRIGHFTRRVPAGFLDSLVHGENRIVDPAIASYYDDLLLLTRGRIFSAERLRAILRVNLGGGIDLDAAARFQFPPEAYRAPPRRHYPADGFASSDSPRALPGGESFTIYWDVTRTEPAMLMAPRPRTDYDVILMLGGEERGRFVLRRQPPAHEGGPSADAAALIEFPPDVAAGGYDAVAFLPREFTGQQSFRALHPIQPPASGVPDDALPRPDGL